MNVCRDGAKSEKRKLEPSRGSSVIYDTRGAYGTFIFIFFTYRVSGLNTCPFSDEQRLRLTTLLEHIMADVVRNGTHEEPLCAFASDAGFREKMMNVFSVPMRVVQNPNGKIHV